MTLRGVRGVHAHPFSRWPSIPDPYVGERDDRHTLHEETT